MIIEFIAISALIGIGGFVLGKKLKSKDYDIYIHQAKAKAKAIENEANMSIKDAGIKIKEMELEAKNRYESELSSLKREYDKQNDKLTKRETDVNKNIEFLKDEQKVIEEREKVLLKSEDEITELKSRYFSKLDQTISVLERVASLTQNEAKSILLDSIEERYKADLVKTVRKYEKQAEEEAKKRANYVIAQATTRFAGEFVTEKLINVVTIPNEDIKGRIIGKEGRNIKALETTLGVDIIIDETPNTITLSSFNIYRRSIASKTLELLIADGRIHPANIEETYEKVKGEFEQGILEEGRNIAYDLGITSIHDELLKLIGKLRYRASYGQNALAHTLEVCHFAGIIAAQLGGDELLAKRAGLLHDVGKALTHELGGSHVDIGADICRRYKESEVVINAIYAHHGHEDAKTIECAAVCTADALSAARPGARREVLESFLKRVQEIEKIAMSKIGVRKAYAINAGREIRVIANANVLKDEDMIILAKDIAKDIENSIQYPGEIKVNIIREKRVIEFAK